MGRSEMKVGCKEHSTRVMKREGGFGCGKPWPVEDHREVFTFCHQGIKRSKTIGMERFLSCHSILAERFESWLVS